MGIRELTRIQKTLRYLIVGYVLTLFAILFLAVETRAEGCLIQPRGYVYQVYGGIFEKCLLEVAKLINSPAAAKEKNIRIIFYASNIQFSAVKTLKQELDARAPEGFFGIEAFAAEYIFSPYPEWMAISQTHNIEIRLNNKQVYPSSTQPEPSFKTARVLIQLTEASFYE